MFKRLGVLLSIACWFFCMHAKAQVTGSFTISGDHDKFYPVTFADGGWYLNIPTELILSRTEVHENGDWRGSLMAKFDYHVTNWGHNSSYIDVAQRQFSPYVINMPFIAGWSDISGDNGSLLIVIWLRGSTTYHYVANVAVNPQVYDGVANVLPLSIPNSSYSGISYTSVVQSYVNSNGLYSGHTAYFTGSGLNHLGGSLGIGTFKTNGHRLAVEGSIGARKIKVDQATWADYVFAPDYQLRSIPEVEAFIKAHNHLPDIPSAGEVAKEGIDVGEMNKKLLQKVEELTLYLIEEHKKVAVLQDEVAELKTKVNAAHKQ